jgi:hypothetical protein
MSDNTFKQNTFPEDKPEPEAAGQEQDFSDEMIQRHIETTRHLTGDPAMDEQTFYEGAKWMRNLILKQQKP